MALNAYLKVIGETQGWIKGSVTESGKENTSKVIAVDHTVRKAMDPSTGMPTSTRQHSPLVLTKEVDKASPGLLTAFRDGEKLTFTLYFYTPGPGGTEQQHYTIELTDAQISTVKTEMLNNQYPDNVSHKEREKMAFCYSKIVWTWTEGGITSEDDWSGPMSG